MSARRRRKPAPCVFCGTETLDWDRVCYKCRQIYRDGQRSRRVNELTDAPQRPRGIRWHLSLWSRQSEEPLGYKDYPGVTLVELIERIAQSPRLDAGSSYVPYPWMGDRIGDSGGGHHTFMLTDDQVEAVEALIELCRRLHRTGYEEGHKKGAAMLVRIASGEVTVDQLNQRQVERARQEK